MKPEPIRIDSVAVQPWRNGGGVTRELLAWPDAGDWRVRISVADIDRDGSFSSFPGVQRWFAVWQGTGVALTVDGVEHRCTAEDTPLRFSGEPETTCRLIDGPTRDLNLMLRDTPGSMTKVVDGEPWRPRSRQCGLFTRIAGQCRYDGQAVDMPEHALLWLEHAPDALAFSASAATDAAPGWWLAAGAAREFVQ